MTISTLNRGRVLRAKLLLQLVAILLMTVALVSCNEGGTSRLTAICRGTGVCDPSPTPAVVIDVVCDASRGSTCSISALTRTFDEVLPFAAERPGTIVRLWTLGSEASDTSLAASQTSKAPERAGAKARRATQARFVKTALDYLAKAAEPFLAAPGRSRSPIAEGLSRVALAEVPDGATRIVVVVSDLREVSGFGDWECGPLPTDEELLRRFERDKVLETGTLEGARVIFTFVGLPPVDSKRCPTTIARAKRVQELWRVAAEAAGAEQVVFEDQAVQPSRLTSSDSDAPLKAGAQ